MPTTRHKCHCGRPANTNANGEWLCDVCLKAEHPWLFDPAKR
jgi:NMD protein affecting ribosome stability and mRNA decay